MATKRERAAQKRVDKLADIKDALAEGRGNLVIRPMTAAERVQNPARPRPEKRGWRTYGR
jgi:hypothetical protein